MNIFSKIKLYWPQIQHYLISSLITFVTGFFATLVLIIDKFDLESIKNGAWMALILVAVRAGFKALIEKFLQKYNVQDPNQQPTTNSPSLN